MMPFLPPKGVLDRTTGGDEKGDRATVSFTASSSSGAIEKGEEREREDREERVFARGAKEVTASARMIRPT